LDFNPCIKHQLIRKTVREFAESEIKPHVSLMDKESRFPWEIIEQMKPLNFFGLQVPGKYGGAGLDTISYAIAIEELSRVSAAIGLCVTVHNSVGIFPILQFGTTQQKEKFVPAMAKGDSIGAFCLTEANAGSDAGGVETIVKETREGFVLNGTKIFVTNGGVCGTILVFAVVEGKDKNRQAGVFIVEKDCPGFSVGEIEDLCGMRANPVSSLFFEDCIIPKTNLLGRIGQGTRIGLTALDTGRIGVAAQALGIAQAAFESSVSYARERQQFNRPLSKFQTIQNYLAEMATKIDASRLLLYRAAAYKDSGTPFSAQASMAKLQCSATAKEVTDLAVQIHGGYGYSKEYDVERYFRDAKVTQIYEGTSEVQKMVIARAILSQPR
jgi:butyryl-CoA dehydrogenase